MAHLPARSSALLVLLLLTGCDHELPKVACGAFPEDDGRGLIASVCVETTVAGEPECDGQVILEGSSSRKCPECTFAFEVESTLVRDDGTNCPWAPELTWLNPFPELEEMGLAYMDEFVVGPSYDTTTYEDVFLQQTFGTFSTSTYIVAQGDEIDGSRFAFDDDTFTWTLDVTGEHVQWPYGVPGDYCDDYGDHGADAASTSVAPAEGQLPFRHGYTDAWVASPEAGTRVTISVDNVQTGDPACWSFHVNTDKDRADVYEGGCRVAEADDNIACEIAPPTGPDTCPAVSFLADGNPYTIWIEHRSCGRPVEVVQYQLRADADGVALPLTQTEDDAEREYLAVTPYTQNVIMTGRMDR